VRDQFQPAAAPPAPAAAAAAPAAGVDIPDQIAKLAALRDQGVLSADEFEAKKAELLDRL
jgi:3-oxoacyl-ACP reductase-like protein